MDERIALKNKVCRMAIGWERLHAEYQKPATVDPRVDAADKALESSVKALQDYLLGDELPVVEKGEGL